MEPTSGVGMYPATMEAKPYKRPKFTTFWFYFIIVVNIGVAVLNATLGDFISIGLNLLTVVGVIAMLSWKKWGFFAILFVQVMALIVVFAITGTVPLQSLASPIISVLILWSVLNAKRDGESTWQHMT